MTVQPNGQPQLPAVNGGAGISPGPDGRTWVTVALGSGRAMTQIQLTVDEAETFAADFADAVRTAAADAKRANLGLIVAQSGGMPTIGPLATPGNGHRPA